MVALDAKVRWNQSFVISSKGGEINHKSELNCGGKFVQSRFIYWCRFEEKKRQFPLSLEYVGTLWEMVCKLFYVGFIMEGNRITL